MEDLKVFHATFTAYNSTGSRILNVIDEDFEAWNLEDLFEQVNEFVDHLEEDRYPTVLMEDLFETLGEYEWKDIPFDIEEGKYVSRT